MSPRTALPGVAALLTAACFHGADVTSRGPTSATDTTTADATTESGGTTDVTTTTTTTGAATTGEPAEPTALRLTKLAIVDPHVYYLLDGQNCVDATTLLNSAGIQNYIDDGNTHLIFIFYPLDPTAEATTLRFTKGVCNTSDTTTCAAAKDYPEHLTTAENVAAGACSTVLDGTLNPSYAVDGAPNIATAPCFTTPRFDMLLPLTPGWPLLPLREVQISARYTTTDDNADLVSGSIRGYLRASDAAKVEGLLITDLINIWQIVAGGDACAVDPPVDDTDPNPIPGDTEPGVWLYLNFEAERVVWLE